MKEILLIMNIMGMENIYMMMKAIILEKLKMGRKMVMGYYLTKIILFYMKENLLLMNLKEKEHIIMKMEIYIKVILITVVFMVKES